MSKDEALDLALEALEPFTTPNWAGTGVDKANEAVTAIKQARSAPVQKRPQNCGTGYCSCIECVMEPAPVQEPVAWMPITEPYPPGDELDILMGDGSVLCGLLPQADGDLWWEGSGTGEKFIDPKYANVTHWRIHSDTTPPNVATPLAAQRQWVEVEQVKWNGEKFIAKLKEKNT
jgi:hypothetical protein